MFFNKAIAVKYLFIGILFTMLSACASVGNFNYVSKEDLINDPLYIAGRSVMPAKSNYGAIKFKQDDAEEEEGSLFILQKKKGVYQAETMFKEEKRKKYFFLFGLNYREQAPMVGFRMEF